MFFVTRIQLKPLKNLMIKWFIYHYKVDMVNAELADYRQYISFNDFFTRKLNNDARPIVNDRNAIASPVDGTVSQAGKISGTDIFQAKGHTFSLRNLLAGDKEIENIFDNGHFATLYLSPKDYHRIHMPIDGQLKKMIYVPGRLFAVDKPAVSNINQLFARNERVISLFETAIGHMAVIKVGALFVASIDTVWAGQISPTKQRQIRSFQYNQPDHDIKLKKGQELGRFNMGSTVILLFQSGRIEWDKTMAADRPITMGQLIGTSVDRSSVEK